MAKDNSNQGQDEDTFLDMDLNDVPEMRLLDDGEEHELMVEQARKGVSKAGENYVMLFMGSASDPSVKTFSNYYGLGSPNDTDKQKQVKMDRFRSVCRTLGVDFSSGIQLTDFEGKKFWGIAGVQENEQYGEQNTLKTILSKK